MLILIADLSYALRAEKQCRTPTRLVFFPCWVNNIVLMLLGELFGLRGVESDGQREPDHMIYSTASPTG